MTDDLKYILNEINSILKTDYNLISFDSMSGDNLLQTLVDVLKYFKATEKFEVKFIERDECVKRIIESLQKIQYRPTNDPSDPLAFRRNLSQADKKTIYPIFRYIFENKDKIHHLTYLAQFLLPIFLPPEAMANPEIANLWNEYLLVMEDFKTTHKGHVDSSIETAQLKELRNDINAIEMEKENVQKRIDRTQSRLDKIPQQELILEAAHVLRIEKDRQKELQAQLEDQKHSLQRAHTMQDRLQKELSNARIVTQGTSAQHLMETIQEETQVMEFMVQQKLPNEIQTLQVEIKLYEDIIDEPNITKDYLMNLQEKVDAVSSQLQKLVEKRLSERGNQNDNLIPFRQQAAIVARNKEMAAEQLNQATKELREIDSILQQKQHVLQETVGEVILRGEQLKQYVNTLRAKSSVYKQQRTELAVVKAEVSDLVQTLENLKSQDPTLTDILQQVKDEHNSIESEISRPGSPMETRGLTELTRIVDGLIRAVHTARDRVTPLSQKLRMLRDRIAELKDDRDTKKQAFDTLNSTLNAEAAVLQGEIAEIEALIKRLETNWQDLKNEYDRAENLLESVRDEMNNRNERPSVKETLQNQILEQENILKNLQSEKEEYFQNQDFRAKQLTMWTDVKRLLEVKLNCIKENKAKGIGGTLSIEKNSETFTLQN